MESSIDEDGYVTFFTVEDIDEQTTEEVAAKKTYNEWIKDGNKFYPAKDTKLCTHLEPGHYSVGRVDGRYFAIKKDVNTDSIYRLPSTLVTDLVDEISTFWEKKDLFEKHGITHKRGIMLAGEPGNGKTSIISQITEDVIKRGGIVFSLKSIGELNLILDLVHDHLRYIEPDTPIVTVIEDIDNIVNQNESVLLNFLDGEDQFQHNVVVATTNRLAELNDLLLRPSRFDRIIIIESPTPEVREFFLSKKGIEGEDLKRWVDSTEGKSMADLKELFISVVLLGNTLEEALQSLEEDKKHISNKTFQKKAKSTGFNLGNK